MLEKRVVMPDPSSASLVRKLLEAPAAAAAKGRGRAHKEQREWRQGEVLHALRHMQRCLQDEVIAAGGRLANSMGYLSGGCGAVRWMCGCLRPNVHGTTPHPTHSCRCPAPPPSPPATAKPSNRVRFNIPSYAEISDEDSECEGERRRGKKGGKRGGRTARASEGVQCCAALLFQVSCVIASCGGLGLAWI